MVNNSYFAIPHGSGEIWYYLKLSETQILSALKVQFDQRFFIFLQKEMAPAFIVGAVLF